MSSSVLGLDFGTDSVRCVLVDVKDGSEIASSIRQYKRWGQETFCNPSSNQFRQHPLDYIESLEQSIVDVCKDLSTTDRMAIKAIGVDTTGSTPVAVDRSGTPLALLENFQTNPNAMFVLWKDHTAIAEAEEINRLAATWKVDYTKYVGGIYSSEWFWAKLLHVLRSDEQVRSKTYSWVEHCDWIPYMLTGGTDVHQMKRSRCAAGHKAMWHKEFAGLPPNDFFTALDPLLDGFVDRLYRETYTSDTPAGRLSPEWSDRLKLSQEVVVAVGAFDAHMGAVGGQIEPYFLSKVMGTSTCDMLVAPSQDMAGKLVRGICGQVDGSIIPGMEGLEAGQSAFGDVYAWFNRLLNWNLRTVLADSKVLDSTQLDSVIQEVELNTIRVLSEQASQVEPGVSNLLALDWLNGRRTPDANQSLKGGILGLQLGSDAPKIFQALVEATCYGARAINDRFESEGVPIQGVIGLGGVARKSPFVMQILADVLNRPIKIARSDQTCALGAAMFAAVAAGIHPTVWEAMEKMGAGFDHNYQPDPKKANIYDSLYRKYQQLGIQMQDFLMKL
ncbi:MAG: ribulokinase [Saprospiraceae bacterium]|nr:ribulokinase [Saprospiraceae bacterium]